MKVKKVDKMTRKRARRWATGVTEAMLNDFRDLECRFGEVLEWNKHYKNTYSCAASIKKAIGRLHYEHIQVTVDHEKVYLINTLIEEEESV